MCRKILLTVIFSLSEALVFSSILIVFLCYPDEPMCTVLFLYGCFLLYVVLPTNVMMKIIRNRTIAKIKMLSDANDNSIRMKTTADHEHHIDINASDNTVTDDKC